MFKKFNFSVVIGREPYSSNSIIEAGQVMTIEPGYYSEGMYGIRIGNCYETVDVTLSQNDQYFLRFEVIFCFFNGILQIIFLLSAPHVDSNPNFNRQQGSSHFRRNQLAQQISLQSLLQNWIHPSKRKQDGRI